MRRNRVKSIGFWLLGMVTAMLIICGFGNFVSVSASTPIELAQKAADSTQQGHQQMAVGHPEIALEKWKEAEAMYETLANSDGVAGSRINQSLALQAMGQSRNACTTLLKALQIEVEESQSPCNPFAEEEFEFSDFGTSEIDAEIHAIGLRNLGDVLRTIGNLEDSKFVLEESLLFYKDLNSSNKQAIQLSLGNTERSIYKQQKYLFDSIEEVNKRNEAFERVIQQAEKALDCYDRVTEPARLRSQLNSLSLLVELDRWLATLLQNNRSGKLKERLNENQQRFQVRILYLVDEIKTALSKLDPSNSIDTIEIYLNFAESLSQLQDFDDKFNREYLSEAIPYVELALQRAEALSHERSKSNANGLLGHLYEQQNNFDRAEKFTESAVMWAQSTHASDIAYRWQHQLGRIYHKQGKIKQAIDAYKTAVDSLKLVRQDLLSIEPDSGFSFGEDVKPIYEELIDLLLISSSPSLQALKDAIEVNKQFQIAELENFLKCTLERSQSQSREEEHRQVASDLSTVTLHIIVLEKIDKVIEIWGFDTEDSFVPDDYQFLQFSDFKKDFNKLQTIVDEQSSSRSTRTLWEENIPSSQALYQAIIAPILPHLPPQTKALNFVLDRTLQNIPMSILQDEEKHYLIEKYNITTRLISGEIVSEPASLNGIIAAGLSDKSRIPEKEYEKLDIDPNALNFKELPYVSDELKEIAKFIDIKTKLMNREFTLDRLVYSVNHSRSPIVHIATHGQFSSDPNKTFLLADDSLIGIRQLDKLLRNRTEGSLNPIELLVLSACQTAKDDKRGGLGLAGIAVKAGARNVVASLWTINDRFTVDFMIEFYQALAAGKTKAEALRDAQLAFIHSTSPERAAYKNPYYWAAFILAS